MTDEEIQQLLKPRHDSHKIIQIIIGCIACGVTVAGIFISVGKNMAAVEEIHHIKDEQQTQHDDITTIRYESKSANAAVQRVEEKVDGLTNDINTQLRVLTQQGRRR